MTRKQARRVHDPDKILNFIVAYKRAHDGLSPTIREIAAGCGISSTSVVAYNLGCLEADGRIQPWQAGRARGLRVTGGRWLYDEAGPK